VILFPSTHAIDAQGAVRHAVPYDGGTVEVWRARWPANEKGAPRGYLLAFTGNGTRAEETAAALACRWGEQGVEVWAVNYPGWAPSRCCT
jgi:hypothetical protein